ncbi:putative pentatricopeptide repeat-containing protein At5g40405 isoform X1 [Cornus florida]|uniref:putative pentatricopeptide repeat-containing protein At5g40405 isoform X1 n=1 Tax=Cornus florida TaxID=4283 RepID=UPI00289ED318|nr:putative pentatricopeptide repeat-containing protein At5g40405 isoform X1 [Cornus florida]
MASLAHPMLLKQKNSQLPSIRATRIPTTIFLLQMCQNFREVRQLHAQLVVLGLINRPPNAGRLIESYVSTSEIYYASSVFDTISYPDVFAYNMMIRGLTLGKCPYDSIVLFNELLLGGLKPDNYTFTFVLKACSYIKALFEGKQVHCQAIKAGTSPDTHIHSSLIHMYANSGSTDSAERVLQQFSEENVLVRNSMISGYLSQGHVQNARAMFDGMRIKDTATWSAMITGYTKNGMYGEALATFQEMMASEVKLNESTLVSALTACAQLGALDQGRWIHTCIDKIKAKISVTLGTSLVDMYAKCGCMDCSYKVFRNMPRKDVVTWGAIISGFALHGQAEKCFELFDEMVANGTCPNEVIFVAILSACSHAGYVELGDYYFEKMVHDFGIRPTVEHYGCMVDLLARAGRLGEAEQLITTMPEEPNSIIWGSLLGGCRNHRDVKRGERAFRQLIELEPLSGDRYKLAGHMFSNVGEKEDADEITKFIKEKKLETTRGSSFIEVDGIIHEFMVGDIDHSRAYEIYGMLEGTY